MRRYHHLGIPTRDVRPGETYLPEFKMYTSGYDASRFGVEWIRFEKDCPLPDLVKTVPHVAFEVDDLQRELEGQKVLIQPNQPSEGITVAFIEENGAPVEFLEVSGSGDRAAAANRRLERNKEIVRRNAEAQCRKDLSLVNETVARGVRRHCQATPGVRVESLEDFQRMLQSDWAAFPDARVEIHRMAAEDDLVAAFGSYTGTQQGAMGPWPATGKSMTVDFGAFFRIEEGKIAEIWVTWDNISVLAQLGHAPPAADA